MKIHITNLYNFKKNDPLVITQHRYAEAGRSLGFLEMGLFSYPVESDTPSELGKRLDGIIASMEAEDIVFLQLPTSNGYEYERRLIHKIKAYKNAKVVLVLHDSTIQANYLSLFKLAEAIIVPSSGEAQKLSTYGLPQLLYCDDIQLLDSLSSSNANSNIIGEDYLSLGKSDFYIKKILMNAIEAVYSHRKDSLLPAPEEEIHIAFGLHDKTGNYSVWVGTAMQSIIEHTSSKICFHILHDSTLTTNNREKLIQVATCAKNRVIFHLLDDVMFANTTEQVRHFTIGTMFRIVLPELLPELNKIIYLDADLFVNRDIKELWDTNISDYCLGAIVDPGVKKGESLPVPVKQKTVSNELYFNAGVLFLNLEAIRQKGNMRKDILTYLANTPDSQLPDQDALNVLYNGNILFLDSSWNYFYVLTHNTEKENPKEKIYHYAGTSLKLYYHNKLNQLYYETLCRTPWGQEEGKKILTHSINRLNDRSNQIEKILHRLSNPSVKRIFYGEENFAMKNMYELLKIHDRDYRVSVCPINSIDSILPCKKLSSLSEEKDEFIVFVLPQADDGTAIQRLEQLGLQNEEDFFVIPRILFPHQGGYV